MTLASFKCYRCGADTDTAPDPPAVAVCPKCCAETSGHDFVYVREMRGHFCANCTEPVPYDWYED